MLLSHFEMNWLSHEVNLILCQLALHAVFLFGTHCGLSPSDAFPWGAGHGTLR